MQGERGCTTVGQLPGGESQQGSTEEVPHVLGFEGQERFRAEVGESSGPSTTGAEGGGFSAWEG